MMKFEQQFLGKFVGIPPPPKVGDIAFHKRTCHASPIIEVYPRHDNKIYAILESGTCVLPNKEWEIKRSNHITMYTGSFNPFHLGHYSIVMNLLNTGKSPVCVDISLDHPTKPSISQEEGERRITQIKEFIFNRRNSVDGIIFQLSNAPYYIDKYLAAAEQQKEDFTLTFAIGDDVWQYAKENFYNCFYDKPHVEFLVFNRLERKSPDDIENEFDQKTGTILHKDSWKDQLKEHLLTISSSDIRSGKISLDSNQNLA